MEDGKEPRWTDASPEEVDREYGGNGIPERELFPRNQDDSVAEPPAIFPKDREPGPDLIELFPEEGDQSSSIKPRAGTWLGYIISQNISGCPPEVSETLETQFAALDGAPVAGTIDASFTHMRIAPQLTWTKTGANSWKGDHTVAIYTRIQWTVQIKTPDLIVTRQQINISGTILGSCEVLSEVNYERQ